MTLTRVIHPMIFVLVFSEVVQMQVSKSCITGTHRRINGMSVNLELHQSTLNPTGVWILYIELFITISYISQIREQLKQNTNILILNLKRRDEKRNQEHKSKDSK
jgi:hypothetical protein